MPKLEQKTRIHAGYCPQKVCTCPDRTWSSSAAKPGKPLLRLQLDHHSNVTARERGPQHAAATSTFRTVVAPHDATTTIESYQWVLPPPRRRLTAAAEGEATPDWLLAALGLAMSARRERHQGTGSLERSSACLIFLDRR